MHDADQAAQDSAAAETAGVGAGTLVAATNCSAGFAGALYTPPSINDVRAWAAAWMFKLKPTRTVYLNQASDFLSAWYLETQVRPLALPVLLHTPFTCSTCLCASATFQAGAWVRPWKAV